MHILARMGNEAVWGPGGWSVLPDDDDASQK